MDEYFYVGHDENILFKRVPDGVVSFVSRLNVKYIAHICLNNRENYQRSLSKYKHLPEIKRTIAPFMYTSYCRSDLLGFRTYATGAGNYEDFIIREFLRRRGTFDISTMFLDDKFSLKNPFAGTIYAEMMFRRPKTRYERSVIIKKILLNMAESTNLVRREQFKDFMPRIRNDSGLNVLDYRLLPCNVLTEKKNLSAAFTLSGHLTCSTGMLLHVASRIRSPRTMEAYQSWFYLNMIHSGINPYDYDFIADKVTEIKEYIAETGISLNDGFCGVYSNYR